MKCKFSFSEFTRAVFVVLFLVCLLSLPFIVGYKILSSHPTTEVIITDTGESIPYDPETCNIIEPTSTIVLDVEGSIVSYSYNDWYYIETVELPSLWDRFLTWFGGVFS